MTEHRDWAYARSGDYHRDLDPNWSYTPTYLRKMAHVDQIIHSGDPAARILDAGCGEGVLVEKYRNEGYEIVGIDLNYESEIVRRGSVLDLPFENGSFEIVLLLDVFEHLDFEDQPRALKEIRRVLTPTGKLVASIPNLAHWNSRLRFGCFGRLDRTDDETNHPGERPHTENRFLLTSAGFEVEEVRGVTLTVPYFYRRVICRRPDRFRWLHDLFEHIALPSLAMINIFVCSRSEKPCE